MLRNLMLITMEGPQLPDADYFLHAACKEFFLRKKTEVVNDFVFRCQGNVSIIRSK